MGEDGGRRRRGGGGSTSVVSAEPEELALLPSLDTVPLLWPPPPPPLAPTLTVQFTVMLMPLASPFTTAALAGAGAGVGARWDACSCIQACCSSSSTDGLLLTDCTARNCHLYTQLWERAACRPVRLAHSYVSCLCIVSGDFTWIMQRRMHL